MGGHSRLRDASNNEYGLKKCALQEDVCKIQHPETNKLAARPMNLGHLGGSVS